MFLKTSLKRSTIHLRGGGGITPVGGPFLKGVSHEGLFLCVRRKGAGVRLESGFEGERKGEGGTFHWGRFLGGIV